MFIFEISSYVLLRFFVRSLDHLFVCSFLRSLARFFALALVSVADLEPIGDRCIGKYNRYVYYNALIRAKVSRLPTECTLSRPFLRRDASSRKLVPVPLHPRVWLRALVPNPVVVVCPPLIRPSTCPRPVDGVITVIIVIVIILIILIIVVPSPLSVFSQ